MNCHDLLNCHDLQIVDKDNKKNSSPSLPKRGGQGVSSKIFRGGCAAKFPITKNQNPKNKDD